MTRPDGPNVMAESYASVREWSFPIVAPGFVAGPESDLSPIPDALPVDAGNSSCVVSGDSADAALLAMSIRESRYADHAQDIGPQGASPGDLLPMPTPADHSRGIWTSANAGVGRVEAARSIGRRRRRFGSLPGGPQIRLHTRPTASVGAEPRR